MKLKFVVSLVIEFVVSLLRVSNLISALALFTWSYFLVVLLICTC